MASGGARGRSGPAPDPSSLRSAKRDADWTVLPAEGCEQPPPAWPLPTVSDREAEVWDELWSRPQAVMWHRLRLADEVALYVRYLTEAEGTAEVSASQRKDARTLVRQHREMLGLSTAGMARLRWRFAMDEMAERRSESGPVRVSARDRLKAIQGGA